MNKFFKTALFFCALSLMFLSSTAQQASLAVDTILNFPNLVVSNYQYNFTVRVRNYSSSAFSGPLKIKYRVSNANTPDTASFNVTSPQVTLSPMGTADMAIDSFMFDSVSSPFRLGGNVVVVWPVATNGSVVFVVDTFRTFVYVSAYAGLGDQYSAGKNFKIFPIPANDRIYFEEKPAEKSFEYVRITDIVGRQRYYSKTPAISVNTEFLEEGVYLIEIKEKNRPSAVSKFIISR